MSEKPKNVDLSKQYRPRRTTVISVCLSLHEEAGSSVRETGTRLSLLAAHHPRSPKAAHGVLTSLHCKSLAPNSQNTVTLGERRLKSISYNRYIHLALSMLSTASFSQQRHY